jgi:hypothetical protein
MTSANLLMMKEKLPVAPSAHDYVKIVQLRAAWPSLCDIPESTQVKLCSHDMASTRPRREGRKIPTV